MNEPKRFVAYGHGFSGDFATFAEAWACRMEHRTGAVYALVNADPVTWDLLGDARRDHVAALTDAQPAPSATPDATRPNERESLYAAGIAAARRSARAFLQTLRHYHYFGTEELEDDAVRALAWAAAPSGSPDEPASRLDVVARLAVMAESVPKSFADSFANNYPPNTVISNPRWHAPELWREAVYAMRAALSAPALASPDKPRATSELHEEMQATFARDIRDAEIRGALWALDYEEAPPSPLGDDRERLAARIVDTRRDQYARSPHEGPTNGPETAERETK